jgi:hypothetical protein
MRTNDNPAFFDRHHLAGELKSPGGWTALGWQKLAREAGAGPAVDLQSRANRAVSASSRPIPRISVPVATACGFRRGASCTSACSAMPGSISAAIAGR